MTLPSGVAFTYRNGAEANHYAILELVGGGVALVDFDRDGLLDLFCPGGGDFTGADQQTIVGHSSRLFKNLGNWQFQDVTKDVGLAAPLFYTHGCAVGDYDRDGWPDLLVTGWGRVALYHNEAGPTGARRFVEVTAQAGLKASPWTTSAAWGDLDGDGYPDVYICQYVNWSFANHPRCAAYVAGQDRDICPPTQFQGLPHLLYRNNGNGTFTEAAAEAGLHVPHSAAAKGKSLDVGKGLGVIIADLNDDGRPDIYVANDTVDNFLYWNRGSWRLQERGLLSGVARDDLGRPNGSMGIDVADFDRTGRASLFVTNYEDEMHALYRNLGQERFAFQTQAAGIGVIGQRFVGFGTAFVDGDGDGWEDLIISNGHAMRHPAGAPVKQRPVLLRNQQGKFLDVSKQAGPYFLHEHAGRGLAVGDLDNDGRPDLVISHVNAPVVLLRNVWREGDQPSHWLGLQLVGHQHRAVVGTKVVVEGAGWRQTRFVKGGGSYLSAHDDRLLFGLGSADKIERVSVHWAWGQLQHFPALAGDRYWLLQEGKEATPRVRP